MRLRKDDKVDVLLVGVAFKLNKLLNKLKSDLDKADNLIQESRKIVSSDRATYDKDVSSGVTRDSTKEKEIEKEISTGM